METIPKGSARDGERLIWNYLQIARTYTEASDTINTKELRSKTARYYKHFEQRHLESLAFLM